MFVGIATSGLEGLTGATLRIATADGLTSAVWFVAGAVLLCVVVALRLPDRATKSEFHGGAVPGPQTAGGR